jgi:hypothetical protein
MSAERIFEDYLEDILEYAEKAHRFLEETPTIDDLQKDERTLLAGSVWVQTLFRAWRLAGLRFWKQLDHARNKASCFLISSFSCARARIEMISNEG